MATKVHWREYSVKQINKVKKEKCINCKYSKRVGTSGSGGNGKEADMGRRKSGAKVNIGNIYCDYLSMTGTVRGCRPEICDKYIPIGEKK